MNASETRRNVEYISQKIYKKGILARVHPDIIKIVIMYYMSFNDCNINLNIDELLQMCNTHKDLFTEAIKSQKEVIEFYANNDEYVSRKEISEAKKYLLDIQTAIGIYYYHIHDGNYYHKRQDGISLFEKTIKYNNPLAQFYLGNYYTKHSEDPVKRQEGIRLSNLFKNNTENLYVKETKYKELIENFLKTTLYKSSEFDTLEFILYNEEKKVAELITNLDKIHYMKDTLRIKAIGDITNTITYIYNNSGFNVNLFYNEETLRAKCY